MKRHETTYSGHGGKPAGGGVSNNDPVPCLPALHDPKRKTGLHSPRAPPVHTSASRTYCHPGRPNGGPFGVCESVTPRVTIMLANRRGYRLTIISAAGGPSCHSHLRVHAVISHDRYDFRWIIVVYGHHVEAAVRAQELLKRREDMSRQKKKHVLRSILYASSSFFVYSSREKLNIAEGTEDPDETGLVSLDCSTSNTSTSASTSTRTLSSTHFCKKKTL